jgi:hypothetical protein
VFQKLIIIPNRLSLVFFVFSVSCVFWDTVNPINV